MGSIVLRRGDGPEYWVTTLTSDELDEDGLRLVVSESYSGIDLVAREVSLLTPDGRVRQWVIDLPSNLDPLERGARTRGCTMRTYQYNDRADSDLQSLALAQSDQHAASAERLLGLALKRMKELHLLGSVSDEELASIPPLVEQYHGWSQAATDDLSVILFDLTLHEPVSAPRLIEIMSEALDDLGEAALPLKRRTGVTTDSASGLDSEQRIEIIGDLGRIQELVAQRAWVEAIPGLSAIGAACFSPFRGPRRSALNWVFTDHRLAIADLLADLRIQDFVGLIEMARLNPPEVTRSLLAEAQARDFEELVDLAGLELPHGFSVIRRLSNTSGFKVVYEARDSLGRPIALKRYQEWATPRMQALLRRLEMDRDTIIQKDTMPAWLGEIRHPHILPCDIIYSGDEPFIIEPLLEQVLDPTNPPSSEVTAQWMSEVSTAVQYLHDAGRVHCDIKADNIGVQDGAAVLIDFGLATTLAEDPTFMDNPGSIKTRAPELFTSRARPTPASDVWALGATLMAMLSDGHYPLLTADEVSQLPAMDDPRRDRSREIARDRASRYQDNEEKFAEYIERSVGSDRSKYVSGILRACNMDPSGTRRSTAGELAKAIQDAAEGG